jgi:ankyrin repeat protein
LRAAEGGLTTLTAAVAKNLPKVVEKLLTVVDKDYINKKSDQGITPLLFAANQVCLSHTAHSVEKQLLCLA